MISSELARELRISASALSRRLTAYCAKAGIEKTDHLAEKVVKDMRDIHTLMLTGECTRINKAIDITLGLIQESPESKTIKEITNQIGRIEEMVKHIYTYVARQETRLAKQYKINAAIPNNDSGIQDEIESAFSRFGEEK